MKEITMNTYDRKVIASTRTDLRLLACIAEFYRDRNVLPRTKSALIGDVLEDFAKLLDKQGKSKIPETNQQALDILKANNFNFYTSQEGVLPRDIVEVLADEEFESMLSEETDIKAAVLASLKEQESEK